MPVGISKILIQIPPIPITAYDTNFLCRLVFCIFDGQFEASAEIITFQNDVIIAGRNGVFFCIF